MVSPVQSVSRAVAQPRQVGRNQRGNNRFAFPVAPTRPAASSGNQKPDQWPVSVTKMKPVWALGTFGKNGRDSRLLRYHGIPIFPY